MKSLLLILDGMGYSDSKLGNAVTVETMPFLFSLLEENGFSLLEASGEAVGLEEGLAGNSEIGHSTIGAGRRIPSTLASINEAYENSSWQKNPIWQAIAKDGRLHLVGLLSDAGVHGHWRSMAQAATLAVENGVSQVFLHPVLDGVDSQAGSAPELLTQLQQRIASLPNVHLGTIMGRKWACDRSGQLDMTRFFVDHLRGARHNISSFSQEKLQLHLEASASEADFPCHLYQGGVFIAVGESVMITNHRADRTKQIAQIFSEENPVYSLIELGDAVSKQRVFFPLRPLESGLGFEFQTHGITNVRISEQCKFPHVTYFLNGFNPDLGEKAICLPSIPESSIKDHPEMSIQEVVEAIITALKEPTHQAIIANVPNLDQVGHRSKLELVVQAAKYVDEKLHEIYTVCQEFSWTLIVTSDHGNADVMIDPAGRPIGSHSLNPVPLVVQAAPGEKFILVRQRGTIANIAATFMTTLGMALPSWMEPSLVA
jgi:2,3-bisphosphoglycerate-independent phosphoglycerate mutase